MQVVCVCCSVVIVVIGHDEVIRMLSPLTSFVLTHFIAQHATYVVSVYVYACACVCMFCNTCTLT